MIDFSNDPFDLAHISILSSDLRYFTEETESCKDDIIALAKQRSSHCSDFVEHILNRYEDEVATRILFSPTLFNIIIRACRVFKDDEIRSFYLDAYKSILPTLETPIGFDHSSKRAIDTCLKAHIKPEGVNEISRMMLELKRIPVAFILQKYLESKPKPLMEYTVKSTYIYTNNDKPLNVDGAVPSPDDYDKLIHALYRICNKLRSSVRLGMQRIYMALSWEAINAQEGTSFSQSFITWLKWAAAWANYLGTRERNDGYPSWCFAPFSMDVCTRDEMTSQLGALYDFICDVLGEERESDVSVRLQPYYGEDVLPDKIVYAPMFTDDPDYDPEIDELAASYTGHIVAKTDFMNTCQRLILEAEAGLYVDAENECVVIPAGKAIEKYQLLRKV